MNATQEQWLPVVGHEGRYEVSNLGRVRTLGSVVRHSNGRVCRYKSRICRQNAKAYGHLSVRLYSPEGGRNKLVHRLVLEAFVGPCPEGMQACHNDGNSSNNYVANLRWDTPLENNLDKIRHGVHHYKNRDRCSRGHEYTPEATRVVDKGNGRTTRVCIHCERDRKHTLRHPPELENENDGN